MAIEKEQLNRKERFFLTLTVFSMFFGAGNLIFPPFMTYQAGEKSLVAVLGFYITAIGLPILGLIATGISGGIQHLTGRVGKYFSSIFIIVVYLAIGPMLAIPRTASTSFEMVEMITGQSNILRLVYSFVFFLVAALIAFSPEKLTSRLGKILCPVLLVLISILFMFSFSLSDKLGAVPDAAGAYEKGTFARGFIDGYQTMDAIAAIVFGMLVMVNVKSFGIKHEEQCIKEEIGASARTIIVFVLVYSAIAFVGFIAGRVGIEASNGAQVLSSMSSLMFGGIGSYMIAMIFIVACLNTCIGLLASCSEYFNMRVPAISYKLWVVIFASVSFVIANAGLDKIISISAPILSILYPTTIVLILMGLFRKLNSCKVTYKVTVYTSLVMSIVQFSFDCGLSSFSIIPLIQYGFAWLLPTVIGFIISYSIETKIVTLR